MSAKQISASDDLTIRCIHKLAPRLIAAACCGESLKLDLSSVERIDTAGVQLLAVLRREAGRSKTRLSFENPSLPVLEMMGFYNLSSLLDGTPRMSHS